MIYFPSSDLSIDYRRETRQRLTSLGCSLSDYTIELTNQVIQGYTVDPVGNFETPFVGGRKDSERSRKEEHTRGKHQSIFKRRRDFYVLDEAVTFED